MKALKTGQIAQRCEVSKKTVSDWIDSGRLKGFRIPGSNHRRVSRENMRRFLAENGIPASDFDGDGKVLVVSQDDGLIKGLAHEMPSSLLMKAVPSAFAAGAEFAGFNPDCVVVDLAIGRTEGLEICARLRARKQFSETRLIIILPFDEATYVGKAVSLVKPVKPTRLANKIRWLLDA